MPKINPKNSTSGKGTKKSHREREEGHQNDNTAELSEVENPDQVAMEGIGKQNSKRKSNGKSESQAPKKLNLSEYQDRQKKGSERETTKSPKNRKLKSRVQLVQVGHRGGESSGRSEGAQTMQIVYHEDGDEVVLELEEQTTEFQSETEGEDPNESDPETEVSLNNNAQRANYRVTDKDSEVVIVHRTEEVDNKDEEAGMQCFVDYITKKGLVIVDASAIQRNNTSQLGVSRGYRKKAAGKADTVERGKPIDDDAESAVTIYRNAVQQVHVNKSSDGKRDSSSSTDEQLDTSDELDKMPLNMNNLSVQNNELHRFIAEIGETSQQYTDQEQLPTTSQRPARQPEVRQKEKRPLYTRAEEMMRDAENKQGRIIEVPGKGTDFGIKSRNGGSPTLVAYHSALLDEDYLLAGTHVDENMKKKIISGDYVDFAKLLPSDRMAEDDHRTEMVNRGGMSYWVPVSDRESTSITNYNKWEQAYRVYSNIYTSIHTNRASELIQYNHVIFTAAQTYVWENVYRYDKEFRIHMSRHNHNRSWTVILQQAWSMYLKDRLGYTPNGNNRSSNNPSRGGREIVEQGKNFASTTTKVLVHLEEDANLITGALSVISLATDRISVTKQRKFQPVLVLRMDTRDREMVTSEIDGINTSSNR